MRAACQGARFVFHLAAIYRFWARDPQVIYDVNVGGTLDEVAGEAVRDSGERAHAAGHDDHAGGGVAAAGDGGSDVVFGVLRNFRGGLTEKFFCEIGAARDAQLFGEDAEGVFRGDEMDAGDPVVGVEGAKQRWLR